jgi:hypothetical protein
MDFIEKLQQKSVQERKRIAFFFSAGITIVIFFFWISFFSVLHGPYREDQDNSLNAGVSSSFSIITDNIKKAFQSAKSELGIGAGEGTSTVVR